MDDDIDIEEHDVLDNPKIKNIFPDLTRIKIEIPDSDDEVVHVNNGPPFVFEDYDDQYNIKTEPEEYPDNFMHNNKIILGTKPNTFEEIKTISNDLLIEEAMNSHTSVVLQDWGERLNQSPCYCHECDTLFATINALDAHKMTVHSFLVAVEDKRNVARKSTSRINPTKFCNHCNKYFADDAELIKHLYELLPSNQTKKITPEAVYTCKVCSVQLYLLKAFLKHASDRHRIIVDQEIVKTNFVSKCAFCSAVKTNIRSYNYHIKKCHRVYYYMSVEEYSSINDNKSVNEYKSVNNVDLVESCIPKGVLFKCNFCSMHIVSFGAALQHSIRCERLETYKCKWCARIIWKADAELHEHHHRSVKPLKIMKLFDGFKERCLSRCPTCKAHFESDNFLDHISRKCYGVKGYKCDCSLTISKSCCTNHRKKHVGTDFSKTDFIIIDFISKDAINMNMNTDNIVKIESEPIAKESGSNMKRKIDFDSVVAVKKPKIDQKVVKRRKKHECTVLYFCDICQCYVHFRNHHLKYNQTGACKDIPHKSCDKCGLIFSHKSLFRHQRVHRERDMTLLDFVILKLKEPNKRIAPKIPNYYKCQKCQVMFTRPQEKMRHKCFQKYSICVECNKKFSVNTYKMHVHFHEYKRLMEKPKPNVVMPEILKKYESMKTMWNILFLCEACNVATDNYDFAVEHSQCHLSSQPLGSVNPCKICHFKFDKDSCLRHMELHTSGVIQRHNFKLLKYNYKNLLTQAWMELFDGLPREQKDQILDRSIYRSIRSVKLKLIKSGRPDLTLYLCSLCMKYVDERSVMDHTQHKNCSQLPQYHCTICQLQFCSLLAKNQHESVHRKIGNVDGAFRIALFNKNDVVYQSARYSKIKNFPVYKCESCKACILKKENTAGHQCNGRPSKTYCTICEQYFRNNHAMMHTRHPTLCKETIIVKNFRLENGGVIYSTNKPQTQHSAVVYKCDCGLHFTTVELLRKHYTKCGRDEIPSECCSKCTLRFPTSVLVNHLCNHHRKNSNITVEQVDKCSCNACDQLFLLKSEFLRHECQESKRTTTPKTKKPAKMSIFSVTRCNGCDLHFLTVKAWYTHMHVKQHQTAKGSSICDICKLKFTNTSLEKHKLHHTIPNVRMRVIDPPKLATCVKVRKAVNKKCHVPKSVKLQKVMHKQERRILQRVIEKSDKQSAQVNQSSKKLTSYYKTYENNTIFKCVKCDLHYASVMSLRGHIHSGKHKVGLVETCSKCGLRFPKSSIFRHYAVHHDDEKPMSPPTIVDYNEKNKNVEYVQQKTQFEEDKKELEEADPLSRSAALTAKACERNKILNNEEQKNCFKNIQNYNNTLYECQYCMAHFINDRTLRAHLEDRRHAMKQFECPICKFTFGHKTLVRHTYIHHNVLKLKSQADFVIVKEAKKKARKRKTQIKSLIDTTVKSDALEIDTSIDSLASTIERKSPSVGPQTKYKHKLYKCGVCNVYYLAQNTCYKHTLKHTPLDTKMFVECKLCGLQFTLKCLQNHIKHQHETEMRLEDVLIEEYIPGASGETPKIDIYNALDKIQSRLVSTASGDAPAISPTDLTNCITVTMPDFADKNDIE